MKSADVTQKVTTPDWLSFSTQERAMGYSIFEAKERFMHEQLTEKTLCAVGIVAIFLGYLVWFLPDSMTPDHAVMTRLTLSIICIGTGIALYFFASRGFRRVLHLDLSNRKIAMSHVNTKNQSLFGYNYAMEEIESIFVRRGRADASLASLHIRIAGVPMSLTLLSGLQDELEELHNLLCRDIHSALDCAPRRVRRQPKIGTMKKTKRPGQRKRARKRYAVVIPASLQVEAVADVSDETTVAEPAAKQAAVA